jgi:hypothetical protein
VTLSILFNLTDPAATATTSPPDDAGCVALALADPVADVAVTLVMDAAAIDRIRDALFQARVRIAQEGGGA